MIHHKTKKKFWLTSLLRWLMTGIVAGLACVGLVVAAAGGAYWFVYHAIAPDIQTYLQNPPPESTKLYAANGTLLYEIYSGEKRTSVPLSEIAPSFRNAILAAEDRDFYEHPGISFTSIIRASILNAFFPDQLSGGSTITQQLVKNVILTPERSVYRKVAEAIWARELERNLTKDQILTAYINDISFGRNTAGIEAASRAYLNKPAKTLSIAESAYLAAIPKAPSLLRPDGKNTAALEERKQYILTSMHELGMLSLAEYKQATAEKVQFIQAHEPIVAPYFVFWLKQELLQKYGEETVLRTGLHVYTTIDLNLQQQAEETVAQYAEKNTRAYRSHNAALVAIDPRTGSVLAMVGGKGFHESPTPTGCTPGKNCDFDPQTNVATALRQVGSSFKPYVYLAAFGEEFKYTPATIISDRSKNFSAPGAPAYVPQNYTGQQFGNVPIRKALAGSLNIAAVNTLSQIGPEPVIETLRRIGITAPLANCGLALALGSCEMTLLEHTNGFATIANMGKHNPVSGIARITTADGKTIMQNTPENKQVVQAQAAYELIDIMTDNDARAYIFGKKSPLAFSDRKVAAKTGTTQNWKDGWTVGFTPSLAVGVWTGNNNGALPRSGSDAIVTAAPLWRAFMDSALSGTAPEQFPEPDGITRLTVNPTTGKVLTAKNAKGKQEVFASYAIPYDSFQLPKKKTRPTPAAPAKPNYSDLLASGEESTIILEPWAGDTVEQTPFDVKVYTGTSTTDTVVELSLDGRTIAKKTETPFLFTISEMLSNGQHTLTAKATHFGLLESSQTIQFKTLFNPPPLAPRGE